MKILTIHPINEDLRFLKKLKRNLRNSFPHLVKTKTLSNNYSSHELAFKEIELLNESDLVLFLCHGGTRNIHGSQFRSNYGSHRSRYVHSDNYGYFINKTNIDCLYLKKVFCLSCNSITLGKLAIESGAKVFIGFNTIDFDNREVLMPKENPRHYVISKTKYALRTAVFNSIKLAINENLTFSQIVHILKVNLNKEMDNLILMNKSKSGYKYYKEAANCILIIKEGIRLFGNGNIRILD